jgi:uncharacterized protein (DUF1330 family)
MTLEVIDWNTSLRPSCSQGSRLVGFDRMKEQTMTAYAVAHMRQVTPGPWMIDYLERIDATLAPFGGRFVVHGGDVEVIENDWPGHLIVIEFPDRRHARDWYGSPAYQAILALRTDNSQSDVIFVDGVEHPHKATDVLGVD